MESVRGATHYSEITKGHYRQLGTGLWLIWRKDLNSWLVSAHEYTTPRGLIDIRPGRVQLPLDQDVKIRGFHADSVIVDDEVNQPSHYKRKSSDVLRAVRSALLEDGDVVDLECIEAMLSHLSTVDQIRGYLRGNSFKYRWRYEDKTPLASLRKADWYEAKLTQLEEIVREGK